MANELFNLMLDEQSLSLSAVVWFNTYLHVIASSENKSKVPDVL
jgi:hypothetical protein